jgi:hypothetical protein
MFEYIVAITQPNHGTTFYRNGHGIYEKDQSKATRFIGYYEAANHVARILADIVLNDPVEIRIMPAWNLETWTTEEILASEG